MCIYIFVTRIMHAIVMRIRTPYTPAGIVPFPNCRVGGKVCGNEGLHRGDSRR